MSPQASKTGAPAASNGLREIAQSVVDIVSDAGEGAQTAGTLFATVCAKMGNGVWTVEIIPAEIEPPARSRAGASGIRVRFGTAEVTNVGDGADFCVALNEQVVYSRIDRNALRPGTILYLDDHWGTHAEPSIREAYSTAVADFEGRGFIVRPIPMDQETRRHTDNPRRGKNVWVVGMLCALYDRDLEPASAEIRKIFEARQKGDAVIRMNLDLLQAGYDWGAANLPERYRIPAKDDGQPKVVMNGNAAIALGAMAAGIEVCSMYPITPATSVSHYLAKRFHEVGGFVHQAEDEIAAAGFAVGASYAGKTAMTVTSGPGMALKTEMLGLAIMAEVPLVVVNVQRGGPSTGLPTKVEQGDLLSSLFGHPGDAPKIVMAPATIEECFHMMVTARQLAETFRTVVILLTDANLATGTTRFPYPSISEAWLSPPVDQSPWDPAVAPYAWDPETGLSERPIPGQPGGMYVLTGLAHDEASHVAYESSINQRTMERRSLKLATLRASLRPPEVFGEREGKLLVIGWGSTRGAIEEAVAQLQQEGERVSALHLRFLSPLEPGLETILTGFDQVMTVEINYSDPAGVEGRRYSQLAAVLRGELLIDIDCWSRVPGQPLPPESILAALRERLGTGAEPGMEKP